MAWSVPSAIVLACGGQSTETPLSCSFPAVRIYTCGMRRASVNYVTAWCAIAAGPTSIGAAVAVRG